MTMTNEEIVRDYNQAANKRKQIKILADLRSCNGHIECPRTIKSYAAPRWGRRKIYCCSPSEIRRLLAQAGVAGVKMPERVVPRRDTLQKAAGAPEAKASAPAPAFYDRVETILAALPEDLSDDTISCVQNLLQTLFADYLGQRLGKKVRNEP